MNELELYLERIKGKPPNLLTIGVIQIGFINRLFGRMW